MGAGALWALSLEEFSARGAYAHSSVVDGVSPYGPIGPKTDETTGLDLLQLPDGFRYKSYSWTGDVMTDDVVLPEPSRWHGRRR